MVLTLDRTIEAFIEKFRGSLKIPAERSDL